MGVVMPRHAPIIHKQNTNKTVVPFVEHSLSLKQLKLQLSSSVEASRCEGCCVEEFLFEFLEAKCVKGYSFKYWGVIHKEDAWSGKTASDRESIESGSDEENDDNGDDVGLGGDDGDGEWLGADNRDDEGLDSDNGDGEGLSGDDEDGECLGVDNGDDEGLDGDNRDCEGLSCDDGDGECLGADNGDGEGLDGDNGDGDGDGDGDGEGLGGDNRDGVFGSQFENVVGNDDITKEYKTTFMIKILVDQHECHRVCNNKEAKVKWIASKFESIVKSNPSINVKVLADLLLNKFNVSVDLKRLYIVKHRVLKQLRFEHVQSFQYLRQYAYTLNQTNPGTHIRVQRPLSTFHRLFLSFEAQRHKGLIKDLAKHFPTASKRFCARHIYANFRGSYCGASFKKLFWRASRSTNIYEFNAALKDIGEIKVGAKEWLAKIEPHLWSRFAFDKVIRCDHVTNNMTEAFNSLLGTHRAQTYLQLLEFIRRMVMRKFQERKEECDAWRTVLPPKVHAKILKHSKTSRQMTIISAGEQEYEIMGHDGNFPVKLREYNCGCGSWLISGIPCSQAMTSISHNYST
ncbi:hypothetical protein Ddye_011561 [Dipteronia dyeriana]|uniref:SWIM-type domain-containing protein n=1 Tax=Dipteronia dyeriana TaxID=168575 RepID=A0AAD9X2S7_9ROSI|nr:hypothetical protein Ddye_011561 [Dipteronia dyeriana]